jgi:hypothetical protein
LTAENSSLLRTPIFEKSQAVAEKPKPNKGVDDQAAATVEAKTMMTIRTNNPSLELALCSGGST